MGVDPNCGKIPSGIARRKHSLNSSGGPPTVSPVRAIPTEGSAELARSEERIVSEVRLRAPTATMFEFLFSSKKPMAAEEKNNNDDDDDL